MVNLRLLDTANQWSTKAITLAKQSICMNKLFFKLRGTSAFSPVIYIFSQNSSNVIL